MEQQKRGLAVVFAVAALMTVLVLTLSGCQHAGEELQKQLGCHLAGNLCPESRPGPQGLPGLIGPTGPGGTAGSTITFVNLCPGVTVYPTAFVEVAMCMNGDLYGVYSANSGFMTYLPPGNYTSNAIGSACNLTVLSNCQVSH